MSAIYDNWERLVGAVLRREQLRQLCLADSRSPSIRSISSDSSITSPQPNIDGSSSSHIDRFLEAKLEVVVESQKRMRKAMEVFSNIDGIKSIFMDMEENKLTITGKFDTVELEKKLRKSQDWADGNLDRLFTVGHNKTTILRR